MKLLIDEMWTHSVAEQLRLRGHDVESVLEVESLKSKPDRVLFAYCLAHDRVIVTENISDFRDLAFVEQQEGREHPGLIFTTPRAFPRAALRGVGPLVRALDRLLQGRHDLRNIELWLRPD